MSGTGKRKFTVGSLFAGIGGFDLGLERTGCFETKWFCELDPYCRRVLAKHWPGVQCHGDITELSAPEPVDVLCGGFPCQDISVAGRGAGLGGARSGLWSEYARLVRELRPRYVIVENVPALRKRGLEVVLADLLACGYDAEWDGIPAAAVGACHRRDRLWIVAYPQRGQLRLESGRECRPDGSGSALPPVDGAARDLADAERTRLEGQRRDTGQPQVAQPRHDGPSCRGTEALADPNGVVGVARGTGHASQGARGRDAGRGRLGPSELAHSHSGGRNRRAGDQREAHRRPESEDRASAVLSDWWSAEPDVGRVADGVPARVDRLRSLGNALVPQIAEWIGYRIAEHEGLI